jgi:excisionase family DNA binding protein
VKTRDLLTTPAAPRAPDGLTQPDLLSVREVAERLGCSPRHVYRLSDGGLMPRPLKLGALVRWSRKSIEQWIASGCPSCRMG